MSLITTFINRREFLGSKNTRRELWRALRSTITLILFLLFFALSCFFMLFLVNSTVEPTPPVTIHNLKIQLDNLQADFIDFKESLPKNDNIRFDPLLSDIQSLAPLFSNLSGLNCQNINYLLSTLDTVRDQMEEFLQNNPSYEGKESDYVLSDADNVTNTALALQKQI